MSDKKKPTLTKVRISDKPWFPTMCFCVLSFVLLGIFKADLLYHMEQYSLFNSGSEFLAKFFEQPGGVLALVGTFLTQFCHYPLVGALLLTGLLALLAYVTAKAFRLEGRAAVLSFVPSLFLILFITKLDYSIYMQRTYGLLFSQILGFLVSVSCLLLYRRFFSGSRAGWVFTLLCVVALYPLVGIYGTFAAVLITLVSLHEGRNRWMNLIVTLAAGAAVPYLCSHMAGIFPRINRYYVYFSGTPHMEFVGNFMCFVPLILAGLSLVALIFLKSAGKRTARLVTLGAAALTVALTNFDPNFGAILKMERAASNRNWDKILKVASRHEDPTRPQVLYRNIALYHKGQLTEQMFTYPDGGSDLRCPNYVPVSLVCCGPVLYYSGLFNTCDRMVMEYSTAYSKNISSYKYQAQTALISGEYDLARKYIDMVAGNLFQGKWVRRYRAFLENPGTMDKDDEYLLLRPLQDYDGPEYEGEMSIEKILYSHYSELEYKNECLYEWQMSQLLSRKNERDFVYFFFNHNEIRPDVHISKGIAQGLALFAGLIGDTSIMSDVVSAMSGQQMILRQFGKFANTMNALQNPEDPESAAMIKKNYPGTYWYYYYFINDIKSN